MKLLRVIRSVNPAGGGPIEGIKQTSRALAEYGHKTEIVSLDASSDSWVKTHEGSLHALGPVRGSYGYNSAWVPWLKANRNRFDAVVIHGLWQYHSFGAWRALAGSDCPYLVYPHGMLDPWFKRRYPLKHLKKWLYWPWAEYRVLRDAGKVLFTSEEEMAMAKKSFWLYRCHGQVIAYGTSAPPANSPVCVDEFYGRFPQLRNKRLILFFGRLHEKKGCDILIEAYARWMRLAASEGVKPEDIHLVMAGPGEAGAREKLQKLAASAGVAEHITWPGMLSGSLKWGALHAAEVFLLPSHQENFGIATVESLACGVPVLISNKVNIWREIGQDAAGFVAEDTTEGAVELLRRWFALPVEERKHMGVRARNCFIDRFEIGKAARDLIRVIEALRGSIRPRDGVFSERAGSLSHGIQ